MRRNRERPYLSEEHAGIGGDGIILIEPSTVADAKMRIFNRDGSEGKMCGNGIRCVGKYLYDNGKTQRPNSRLKPSAASNSSSSMCAAALKSVTVDMGRAELRPEDSRLEVLN